MRPVVMVIWIALVACDRGAPPRAVPPPNATVPTPRVDAAVVVAVADATEPVATRAPFVATVLAPAKPAAAQKRDCALVANRIAASFGGDAAEKIERNSVIRKACIDAPWSATIVDCALHATTEPSPYDCTDQLPDDQRERLRKTMKAVFCKHNDCIPDGLPPEGRSLDLAP
jgi:hypothetical protein